MALSAPAMGGQESGQESGQNGGQPAGQVAAQPEGMAATDASDTTISYDAEFFSVFSPITALDMVERLPGFTIEEGDSVRGFGGAAGNVLINGERPSAKGQTLTQILSQIPADSVIRVDLIRGRQPGIDMRGQPTVANLIRRTSQTSGFAEAELRLSEGMRITPNGEVSLTGEFAGTAYTIGAERFMFEDIDDQPERFFSADRVLLERRPEQADIIPHQWTATINLERPFGAWTVRSNNELFLSNLVFRESSPSFDAVTGDFLRANTTRVEDNTTRIEIGGDAERALSDSLELKLIGLQTIQEFESDQMFDERRADASQTLVTQTIDENSGESILRGILSMTPGPGWTAEFGAEGAYNFLDSSVDLAIDTGGGPVPQDLPVSDTKVEEIRAEPFANVSWSPVNSLTLEGGLAVEISSLKQSGDAEEERSFMFAKPSLSATYDVSSKDQLRLNFRRDVAQLDFTDFVSSVTLNEETTDLGNPELEPQRDWILSLVWERRFSDSDSIALLVERKWLQAVQALVPIGTAFEGPGNIGGGTAWRARIDWQFSLDEIGLDNAVFEGWYQFLHSEVRDPVTGALRQLSFDGPGGDPFRQHQVRAEFRQDFEDSGWAWGWDYFYGSSFQEFRLNESRRTSFGAEDIDVFVQTTRFLGLLLRLEAGINEPTVLRERTFFTGPRSGGTISAFEIRDRQPEKQLLFTVRKAF